jgi:YebC/PmpR family DNA-binding regulatory protein
MAGHSKWKNNLSRKTAQDKKRSASFAKLSKAITIAVMEGGSPDPEFNPRLRVAIEKARESSMPKDNIDRAIAKGSGAGQQELISLVFEIFGPGGSQILATATTDNQNRTYSEIRTLVDRNGGKLGNTGSISHGFTHCAFAVIRTPQDDVAQEALLTLSDTINALDIVETEDHSIIFFPYQRLKDASIALTRISLEVVALPEVTYRPLIEITLDQTSTSELSNLIQLLEDHDDIQEVYTNVQESTE